MALRAVRAAAEISVAGCVAACIPAAKARASGASVLHIHHRRQFIAEHRSWLLHECGMLADEACVLARIAGVARMAGMTGTVGVARVARVPVRIAGVIGAEGHRILLHPPTVHCPQRHCLDVCSPQTRCVARAAWQRLRRVFVRDIRR